jgi:DNA-binding transcriptional MocR family regulator
MCLDSLEAVLATQPVACVLVNPCFLNPLGAAMPDSHKVRLAAMLHRFDTWAIEDDIYGDLGHDPAARPRPLRAFDSERVLFASSFSKSLAPGYRVGWLCPGPFLERAMALQFAQLVATPTPTALAVAAYLEEGGFERHLRRLRPRLASQVAQYSDAIASAFPPGTRISNPSGGFVLWVELDAPANSDAELQRLALERRIAIAPGSIFSARERFSNAIRISCGAPLEGRFARAMTLLGELAHRVVG